jgi:hypothetical protein
MIATPRCGQPVRYHQLSRPADPMDVVPREPGLRCFRRKGHAEDEIAAGKPVRHASEASYRRSLAQAVPRKRAWRRARQRVNDSGG